MSTSLGRTQALWLLCGYSSNNGETSSVKIHDAISRVLEKHNIVSGVDVTTAMLMDMRNDLAIALQQCTGSDPKRCIDMIERRDSWGEAKLQPQSAPSLSWFQ